MKRAVRAEVSHFSAIQIFGHDSTVRIESTIDPVSLQANSERKRTFQTALAAAVKKSTDRIFTGDVKAEITWFVSEERRYSTHIVADIDNIIKPLFDAVTGPEGVLIDDNQVQQVASSWLDAAPGDLKFEVIISALSPLQFIPRENLRFVDFGSPYGCMLMPDGPELLRRALITTTATAIRHHRSLLAKGIDPAVAKMHMPMQRFYPSARLRGFDVEEFLGDETPEMAVPQSAQRPM
jgi:Holliday junction resolvase RusA-like endonuclease